MNDLKIFTNKEFGGIRVFEIDGQPWFVGKDMASILGYQNTKDAILSHVDAEDRQIIQRSENATFEIPNRGLTIINESGFYGLVLASKLPNAKQFKHWVTSEVLPSIRRSGGYSVGGVEMDIEKMVTLTTAEVMSQMTKLFMEQIPLVVSETVKASMQYIHNAPVRGGNCANTNYGENLLAMNIDIGPAKSKIETFPAELLKEIDGLIGRMLDEQALNFSMIARFCTMKGYSISSPSVKKYFDKKMSGTENQESREIEG